MVASRGALAATAAAPDESHPAPPIATSRAVPGVLATTPYTQGEWVGKHDSPPPPQKPPRFPPLPLKPLLPAAATPGKPLPAAALNSSGAATARWAAAAELSRRGAPCCLSAGVLPASRDSALCLTAAGELLPGTLPRRMSGRIELEPHSLKEEVKKDSTFG